MGIAFNADEVFEMAIRAEKNGAAFYRKAAGLHKDAGDAGYLRELAAMEDEHEKIFSEMRSQLAGREKESTAFDPDNEGAQYLRTMMDQQNVEGAPSIAAKMTGNESMEKILRTAIDLEKEAILFYLGLLDMVSKKRGKDRILGIIQEEKGHVVGLSERLGRIGKG